MGQEGGKPTEKMGKPMVHGEAKSTGKVGDPQIMETQIQEGKRQIPWEKISGMGFVHCHHDCICPC